MITVAILLACCLVLGLLAVALVAGGTRTEAAQEVEIGRWLAARRVVDEEGEAS